MSGQIHRPLRKALFAAATGPELELAIDDALATQVGGAGDDAAWDSRRAVVSVWPTGDGGSHLDDDCPMCRELRENYELGERTVGPGGMVIEVMRPRGRR